MPTEKNLTGYPSIDKPWLKYYTEEAINSKTPKCSIYQNIYDGNADHLSDVALLFFGKKFTYKQLFAEIDKAAKAFVASGVQWGENVVLCMPAIPETIYAILALNKIGANAVMLNPLFTEEQLIARISETDAKLMVVVNELYERVENVIPRTAVKKVVSCAAVNSLGAIIKLIKKAKTIPGTTAWNNFLKQGRGINLIVPEYEPKRPAIMVYSSGTTGASKGIQLTNDSINSTITEGVQIGFEWQRGDRWFSQIPVWFSTGICAQTLVPLKYGITIILEPVYDFEVFYQHIIKYKPNFMITACGLLDYLMTKQPKAEAYQGFKFLCAGGEYVTPSAEKKYNDWLKSNNNHYGFFKGYGMCECGGTVTASSPKSNAVGSAGIPTPNVVVSAFDLETGKECKYGERGEIRVDSPTRMKGYFNNEKATNDYFYKDKNGVVWGCTGDIGYVDEDGEVFILGRATDCYYTDDGKRVFQFDIEEVILQDDSVSDCKVVQTTDKSMIVAHIILKDGCKQNSSEVISNIHKNCTDKLDDFAIPTHYKIRDSFPVHSNGKRDNGSLKNDTEDLIVL